MLRFFVPAGASIDIYAGAHLSKSYCSDWIWNVRTAGFTTQILLCVSDHLDFFALFRLGKNLDSSDSWWFSPNLHLLCPLLIEFRAQIKQNFIVFIELLRCRYPNLKEIQCNSAFDCFLQYHSLALEEGHKPRPKRRDGKKPLVLILHWEGQSEN